MNWLDWFIITVLALSAIQGLRYGLVASVAKLAGILAGLWVAYNYYRPFAEYLSAQWSMEEKLMPLVDGLLKYWLPSKNAVPPALPPGKLISAWAPAANQLNPLGETLGRMFSSMVLEALSFMILLLVTVWTVNLVGRLLTKVADITLMGPLNHLGGLFFGAAKGILVVMVVLTLMSPFQQPELLPGGRSGIPDAPSLRANSFQDSKLLPYFEPLFRAINRPLPGVPPQDYERTTPAKNI